MTPAERLKRAIHDLSLRGTQSRDEAEALGRLSYYLTVATAEKIIAAVSAPDLIDAARYRYLRDDNAYEPEESMVRGGDDLDQLCDRGLADGGNG